MLLIGSRFSSWFPDVDDGAAPAARRLYLNPHPPRRFRGQPAEPAELSVPCYPTRPTHVILYLHAMPNLPFLPFFMRCSLLALQAQTKAASRSVLLSNPSFFFSFPFETVHAPGWLLSCSHSFLALPRYLPQRVWFLGGIYLLPIVPRARFWCCSCLSLCLSPCTPLPPTTTEVQRPPP